MGCGCGRKGTVPRKTAFRPTVGPRPLPVTNSPTPSELRALSMKNTSEETGASRRMDDQKRKADRIRRDAIRKKLGK